jgi:hypothetical protein
MNEAWGGVPRLKTRPAAVSWSSASRSCLPVRRPTAANSSYENSRPMAAPICATSLIGASRSSRAISEACKLDGIASGGSGRERT